MKISALISDEQTNKLGHLLRKLQPRTETLLDPRLFPNPEDAPEKVTRFFFFTTSIDHRTSPPGQSFEGYVEDQYFQGADLLWHLSLQAYQESPDVFSPSNMAKITTEEVRSWFAVHQPVQVFIRNPAERALLLRDCGQKLVNNYNSSVLHLLEAADHRIAPTKEGISPGFLRLLSGFKAYEDPANKKSFLFLKFLLRRELWTVHDIDQLRIPIDNHLTRIALRTGIISLSPSLTKKLTQRQPFTLKQDVQLRQLIGESFSLVAKYAQQSVLDLDDFFWHFGRNCCLYDSPMCESGCSNDCFVATQLLSSPCKGECPLMGICLAYSDVKRRRLVEPEIKTWYY